MKKQFFLWMILVLGCSVVWTQPNHAQGRKRHSRTLNVDVFKNLKVGQWLQIDGIPQKTGIVMAHKVKFKTGDFQNDDWEVFGEPHAIDHAKKEFRILNLKIKATKDTEYETKDRKSWFVTFKDLKPGMLVEAEGTYLKDGTFIATQIEDKTKREADNRGTVQLFGKVEAFNARNKMIRIMGVNFKITSQTKVKSAIK
ncbi:MAG: hypothetical protein D6814_02960 [Calditrichaeota bacterium]|nr:MAG: hypothetical protein D6814_02960 [Calditrichota bacterium]